jgi:hypothetical protein
MDALDTLNQANKDSNTNQEVELVLLKRVFHIQFEALFKWVGLIIFY